MNYRYVLLFFVLLQLSSVVLADCIGYSESFDVRVLDAKLRPIPGAAVTITYDRGATFGAKYFTTPIQLTNAAGIVHFDINNQGTISRPIDCTITANASAGGRKNDTIVIAKQHGSPIDITLVDVYPVQFYVKDQLGAPLPNASVTLGNQTKKTDGSGVVKYFFKVGDYEYFVNFLDGKQAGVLPVVNDTVFEVKLPYYKIVIEILDDFGEPLNSSLFIFNTTFQLSDGRFEYNRTFGEEIPYTIEYKGLITEDTIMPAIEPNVKIVYDTHAPLFGEIKSENANGRPKLTIPVSDPGTSPSGIDFQSLKVTYRLEPADPTTPWSVAVTFTSGRNTFAVEFPELPPNSIVQFRAEVKDKEGNKANIEGKFSTFAAQPPQNDTQNQTNTPPPGPQDQGIPLFYIIVGVIVAVLAIYVVFRIKSKANGGV